MNQPLTTYLDPRIIRIFFLGIASGLPWVAIGSVLTLWLQEVGLTRSSIGYAGIIFAAYSVNFLWSPLADRASIPVLSKLGQRKSWLLLSQLCIAIACLMTATTNPSIDAKTTVLFCLFIAIASATQDIVIDAFRIESVPAEEHNLLAAGAAMATAGWWTGFAGLGAVALWTKDYIGIDWGLIYAGIAITFVLIALLLSTFPEPEKHPDREKNNANDLVQLAPIINSLSLVKKLAVLSLLCVPFIIVIWALTGSYEAPSIITESSYYIPGLVILSTASLCIGISVLAMYSRSFFNLNNDNPPEAGNRSIQHTPTQRISIHPSMFDKILTRIVQSVVFPLTQFFSHHGFRIALQLLAFIVLFKIGEAFLGRMSIVFYKEIGFSTADIATYSKLGSWIVTVLFSIISGWFTIKYGIVKGLFIAGAAMAASNLMFSLMAIVGPVKWVFASTILIDGFTSAWSSVAFVAFISSLCNRRFTATHYALLASLGTLGRTLFASSSGQMVDALNGDWAVFFLLTALMVLPSLLLLAFASRQFEHSISGST